MINRKIKKGDRVRWLDAYGIEHDSKVERVFRNGRAQVFDIGGRKFSIEPIWDLLKIS